MLCLTPLMLIGDIDIKIHVYHYNRCWSIGWIFQFGQLFWLQSSRFVTPCYAICILYPGNITGVVPVPINHCSRQWGNLICFYQMLLEHVSVCLLVGCRSIVLLLSILFASHPYCLYFWYGVSCMPAVFIAHVPLRFSYVIKSSIKDTRLINQKIETLWSHLPVACTTHLFSVYSCFEMIFRYLYYWKFMRVMFEWFREMPIRSCQRASNVVDVERSWHHVAVFISPVKTPEVIPLPSSDSPAMEPEIACRTRDSSARNCQMDE